MNKFIRKMTGRDVSEAHRVATPLELFFDLVFVIAIASAAGGLHHSFAEHHISAGLLNFGIAFFSIWWGWMNYTWFASAFDNDDTIYRIYTMLQMFGAIIMAIGIPDLFKEVPDMFIVVVGYAIMRVAMALQWIRAARSNPQYRNVCLRYAVGIILVQILWILRYILAPQESFALISVVVLMFCELLVPLLAGRTPWHPHHIAERYGLLVIIVLGEGLLGVSNTIKNVLALEDGLYQIFFIGTGVIALIFVLWWLYFNQPYAHVLEQEVNNQHLKHSKRSSFFFAYLHFFIFASLASIGVGVSLVGDAFEPAIEGQHQVTMLYALRILSVTTSIYLFFVAVIRILTMGGSRQNYMGLLLVFLSPILCMIAIETGLSATYTVWLGLLSPILMILLYGKTTSKSH
ncbi:low temperature requirement protein A [Capnocytophaga sp.]|uniref:low temperature requirement protein A n=1 Tax=Capnocytophaga sp. TaxID=44737 RepID=UPI0026DD85FB|nr:low temperature requirement protein A [Capnocytophaga sp.]MDO5105105.1 low temperature requirement protein A [Capnocytophaga sp.]